MRKEYGKALREVFTQELKVHLPQFLPVKSRPSTFLPEREDQVGSCGTNSFLDYTSSGPERHEALTVELGWSRLGRFPELGDEALVQCSIRKS